MKIILLIVAIVGLIWSISFKKKIDKEQAIGMKTPGTATRLRENFGDVVDMLLQDDSHHIIFERDYDESIRIGNKEYQDLFLCYSALGSHGPELFVSCIQGSTVLKEWKFDKLTDSKVIYQEISSIFS